MELPWWVHASCTAVKALSVLPAAILTRMTPCCTVESPIFASWLLKSIINKLPLPVGGGGVPPSFGEGLPPLELHDTRLQPAHSATSPVPSFDKKSCLSIIYSRFLYD